MALRTLDANFHEQLVNAYDTSKDPSNRREYDSYYHVIRAATSAPKPGPSQPNVTRSTADSAEEHAQVAALQKSKQERSVRWDVQKRKLEAELLKKREAKLKLEKDIRTLEDVARVEAATKAWEKSWLKWAIAPLYKKPVLTEKENALNDRKRQERHVERLLKLRRLEGSKALLVTSEADYAKAKEEVDAADRETDRKIGVLYATIHQRKANEQAVRDRVAREHQERIRKQKEQERAAEAKEAAEALRKWQQQQEEARKREAAAAQARWYAKTEGVFRASAANSTNRDWSSHDHCTDSLDAYSSSTSCVHDGWWPKIQGRAACPVCGE
jgi:hypothetical protein